MEAYSKNYCQKIAQSYAILVFYFCAMRDIIASSKAEYFPIEIKEYVGR